MITDGAPVEGVTLLERGVLTGRVVAPRLDREGPDDVRAVLASCRAFDAASPCGLRAFRRLGFEHPLFTGRGEFLLRWLRVAPTTAAFAAWLTWIYPDGGAVRLLLDDEYTGEWPPGGGPRGRAVGALAHAQLPRSGRAPPRTLGGCVLSWFARSPKRMNSAGGGWFRSTRRRCDGSEADACARQGALRIFEPVPLLVALRCSDGVFSDAIDERPWAAYGVTWAEVRWESGDVRVRCQRHGHAALNHEGDEVEEFALRVEVTGLPCDASFLLSGPMGELDAFKVESDDDGAIEDQWRAIEGLSPRPRRRRSQRLRSRQRW